MGTMEQHPVPQNVTTFQFRLIGDMTIKQFGYLAGGVIIAYICYKLPLPFFFTWPLTIASALFGFGLAFVPVEERPMDVWVLSFFKSIYSPTEYLWSRSAGQKTAPPTPSAEATTMPQPAVHRAPGTPIRTRISQLFSMAPTITHTHPTKQAAPKSPTKQNPAPTPIKTTQLHQPAPRVAPSWYEPTLFTWHVADPFGWIRNLFRPKPTPIDNALPDIFNNSPTASITGKRMQISGNAPLAPAATQAATQAIDEAQKKTTALEEKLGSLEKELGNKTMSESRILELQKQLTEALQQRSEMEKEIIALRQQAATPHRADAPTQQAATTIPTASAQPTVRIINPQEAVYAGLPRLTTFPNVVAGIVKDHDNELLAGVLVTVRDVEGIPLRALKTNKLGQFAASTPLPNGTYLVEVEDPRSRYTFDRAQISLNGTLVPTIEITAKSPKALSREKLAKEIFGGV